MEIQEEISKIKIIWKSYVEELFPDQRDNEQIVNTITSSDILLEEVEAPFSSFEDVFFNDYQMTFDKVQHSK